MMIIDYEIYLMFKLVCIWYIQIQSNLQIVATFQ